MKVKFQKKWFRFNKYYKYFKDNANSPNDCLVQNRNIKFVNQNNHINFLSSKGKSKFRLNNILLFISFIINNIYYETSYY